MPNANFVNVTVVRTPGKVQEVALSHDDATVEAALEAAEIKSYDNCTLTVNGQDVDLNDTLHSGTTLLVAAENIKGA